MSYAHLTDLFFEQHFPKAEFLGAHRELENWSKTCVPLSTWQGIVFVGFSTENPPQLINKNYVFVRASQAWLEKVFAQISAAPAKALDDKVDIMDLMASAEQNSEERSEGGEETADEPSLEMLDLNIGNETVTALSPQLSTSHQPPEKLKSDADSDWAQKALAEMKVHFQKAMILTVENQMAVPTHWDPAFAHQGSSTNMIPLNTASPFRIVHRTHKPYHGHIVGNDLNEKFFDEWNKGITPDHITLAAIIVNDEVAGMLLGIGEKASDNKISLAFTEKLAANLAPHFNTHTAAA